MTEVYVTMVVTIIIYCILAYRRGRKRLLKDYTHRYDRFRMNCFRIRSDAEGRRKMKEDF